ncbi:MAG TPA: hypothetical protein PLD32_09280 [Saprospiraceae bacterium]|nr:hypothetical protein [Saprospiraceae bacterium]
MIRKAAVKGAAPNSGIVFLETEINDKSTIVKKSYAATPTTLLPLTSITVTKDDGTDVVITAVSAATNQSTLAAILKTEVAKLGYVFSEDYGLNKEYVSVAISGQTLTVKSELTFKSMVAASGSPSFTGTAI